MPLAEIHDEDGIFTHILLHGTNGDRENALQQYFAGGIDCAAKLQAIAETFLAKPPREATLLEFACGSGRVTRHLLGRWKEIGACDIQASALDFLRCQLGVDTYPSSLVPEALPIARQFDVVFALSFFSHISAATFARWLVKLSELVEPGGLLVFTTHSAASAPYLRSLGYTPADGDFWFVPNPSEEYGQAIASPRYVEDIRARLLPNMNAVDFRPAFWWGHQDLHVWRKLKEAP